MASPKRFKSNSFLKNSNDYIKQKLESENAILQEKFRQEEQQNYFPEYRNDPVAYANKVLGTYLWSKQRQMANALVKHRRVLVRSSHTTGKSFACANLALWAYDTHRPLSGVITATTDAQVKDVVFAEMRTLARPHHTFRGTDKPTLQDDNNHVIRGLVTADPTSMHGRHQANNFLLIDEATGVKPETWEAMGSLFESNAYWIAVYNPTDVSSYVHHLESVKDWHLITISAFDHPNIKYAMANFGDTRVPIPGCITLPTLRTKIRETSDPINKSDARATDIMVINEVGDEEWYRPGPICESRYLGRWPSQSFNSVWSDTLVDLICNNIIPPDYEKYPIEIGVDVARFGDDSSAIVARCGPTIIFAEEYNGFSTTELTSKVIEVAYQLSERNNTDAHDMPIKVDSNGIGGSIVDSLYGQFNVVDVDVNARSYDPTRYDRIRSELWFNSVELAKKNQLSLYLLDDYMKHKFRSEMLSPHYSFDSKGRMVVESKKQTTKRTKQASPNLLDGMNLAMFSEATNSLTVTVVDKK